MHELVIIETGHVDSRFKHEVYILHVQVNDKVVFLYSREAYFWSGGRALLVFKLGIRF